MNSLSDFELDKLCIDRISCRKFLGFPEYILDSTPVWSFRKRTINNYKENKYVDICKANLISLVLKIKKRIIQNATFIHSYPGHAKSDKPRENEAKKYYSETEV